MISKILINLIICLKITKNILLSIWLFRKMVIGMKLSFYVIFLITTIERVNSWCLKSQFSDSGKINSIDFSRDGSKIVTASDSNRVIVWDAHTLEILNVYNLTVKAFSAKFSKNNNMIAIGG